MPDLRTYLDTAKRSKPEDFLEIKEKHDINLEVCALVDKLEKQRRTPLLLFSNINNLSGEPSEFPLLMNAFGSRRACAMALGLPPEQSGLDLVLEFQRREAIREKPIIVRKKEAPVKEVIPDPNLHLLPILTHHLEDKGPYLTMTWSASDPETGAYHSS
ncbi:MAG: UbiD family decarboxylase domain-containing protein, partial [Candidatus Binatia bacterium]